MYDRILVPTDGSPGAKAAIDHAIHVATQNDAVVHAVHAEELIDLDDATDGTTAEDTVLEADAETALAPVVDAAEDAGLEVVEAVVEGRAQDRLIEYVEEEGIDLIVMGTHGKDGLSRVLLGSTTEKVVRNSPAPVLAVPENGDRA